MSSKFPRPRTEWRSTLRVLTRVIFGADYSSSGASWPPTSSCLLLQSGDGVLIMAFKLPRSGETARRSRTTRTTTLAVPYQAKDVPARNTQFGHPDITIILTCLSYYYAGLSEEQLRVAFEILLNQDDPSTEYALWIEYESVPDSLQKLGEINLKSSEQWDKVTFPLFSRNKAAIDLYLSRVVFPKEAKEFPWKISGSSWDLVEKREKPIIGERTQFASYCSIRLLS